MDLLHALMSQYRTALKDMGDETIVGITDIVSGEKDPRNLMIIFSILRVIMVEWDITSYAEALFDSVFCYFPITFRPPPDDPYGITAQDLKTRLRDCIAASEQFAPFAFPQLIDKLDSTSPNVKKDVLQTIASCATSYGVTQLSNYSVTLWDSLKYEILNVQEEDLADEALAALQAIASRLSHGLTSFDQPSPLAIYLRPITKECNEQLQEPQHKQAKPAGQILSSLSRASPIALYLVVRAVMPSILTIYQAAESILKQRALLEVLIQIFDSAIAIQDTGSSSSLPKDILNPLELFKDRFFMLASQALMSTAAEEVSFRVMATRALLRLCSLRNFLQENEAGMIVQYLDEIILLEDSNGRDDLKNEAIKALVEISKIKPNLIMSITFPAFMARLPDYSPSDQRSYLVMLEGLARLSVERTISETLIRRLLSKLDLVLENDGSSAYARAILSTLYYVLSQRNLAADSSINTYYEKIVVGLINRVVSASMGQRPTTALNDELALETLGRLANLIVRALDQEKQQSVGLQIYSLFADKGAFLSIPDRPDSPRMQRMTMILSTWLMAGIRRANFLSSAGPDHGELQILLDKLVRHALSEDVPAIRNNLLRQISLITNKFLSPEQIYFATDILWKQSSGLIEAEKLTENSIRVIFWISKGLILRQAKTEEVLQRLLSLLSSESHGLVGGRGFGLLLAPDEVLSKENDATIRLLSKQKVFDFCIPRIAADFRQVEIPIKPNYLIALSGILKYMPIEIVVTEIETLLPLLLQSLDLKDQDVKAATIESLFLVSQESSAAVEGHIPSLINRLLKTAEKPNENVPRVRLNALRCLRTFPGKVKDSALLPYRYPVTRTLWEVLDDPKRDVRKAAVECRAAWLNLDEPDEED